MPEFYARPQLNTDHQHQQQSLFVGTRTFDPANLNTADPLELSSHFVDEFLKADNEFPEMFTYLDCKF